MASPILSAGGFFIDTGVNDPLVGGSVENEYAAKVRVLSAQTDTAGPLNVDLFNIICTTKILRATTQYAGGSTSFPNNIGDGRIYILVDCYIQFSPNTPSWWQPSFVKVTSVEWKLIGPIR